MSSTPHNDVGIWFLDGNLRGGGSRRTTRMKTPTNLHVTGEGRRAQGRPPQGEPGMSAADHRLCSRCRYVRFPMPSVRSSPRSLRTSGRRPRDRSASAIALLPRTGSSACCSIPTDQPTSAQPCAAPAHTPILLFIPPPSPQLGLLAGRRFTTTATSSIGPRSDATRDQKLQHSKRNHVTSQRWQNCIRVTFRLDAVA